MERENFENYLGSTYCAELINIIEQKSQRFRTESYMGRDAMLRKIHVIAALNNTIALHGKTHMELKRRREDDEHDLIPFKYRKIEGMASELLDDGEELIVVEEETPEEAEEREYFEPHSPEHNPGSPYYDPLSPVAGPSGMQSEEYPDSDEDIEMIPVIEKINETVLREEKDYRFICPFFLDTSNFVKNFISGTAGSTDINKIPAEEYDIIDRERGAGYFVIETSIELFRARMREKHAEFDSIKECFLGYIIVDYEKGTLISSNVYGLNFDSARGFIARRQHNRMKYFPRMIPSRMPYNLISDVIKVERYKWSKDIINSSMEPITPVSGKELGMPEKYPVTSLREIIELLTDLESEDEEMVRLEMASWNGKILPHTRTLPYVFEPNAEKEQDKWMIKNYFPKNLRMVNNINQSKDNLIALDFVNAVSERSSQEGFTNLAAFKTSVRKSHLVRENNIDVNEIDKFMEMFTSIGYKMKKKKHGEYKEDMKQPDYETETLKSAPIWMDDVFREESELSGTTIFDNICFEETAAMHPMDKITVDVCSKIKKIYNQRNIACTVSKYMSVCARLAGAYLINISKENKAHSTIAVMPIYFKENDEGILKHNLSGFLIRGPQHVRDSGDMINIITIEKIKPLLEGMISKGLTAKDDFGNLWLVRKNAITKAAPLYGTFLNNLLFLPVNYLGDIIYKYNEASQDILESSDEIINKNVDFIVHRMVELSLMGLLGGSQEEGYFSGYRMLYMLLLELSRGFTCGLVDAEGFIESMNECLISHPLVLHTHVVLRRTLFFIHEVRNRNSEAWVFGNKEEE